MTTIVIFSLIVLIVSVVVHEVAHGYMAYLFGDMTAKYQGRLTFNPIKHIDPFGSIILPFIMSLLPGGLILGWAKPVPINPYNFTRRKLGEFMTAFAGPLSNILIASVFIVLIRFAGELGMSQSFVELSFAVVLINSVLAFFNLIPIPPLDGYRILSVLLPVHAVERFEYFAQRFGIFLVLFFVLFLWNPIFMMLLSLLEILTGLKVS
jgi:Zn-dependent protease